MSTRGNYVFIDYPYKENEEGKWVKDVEQIARLKKGISNDVPLIKDGFKVYLHNDNYPSYTIPKLFQFLNYPGAIARGNDASYLAAWFIADRCVNDLLKYRLAFENDDISFKDGSYKRFLEEYVPIGEDIGNIEGFLGIGLTNCLNSWAEFVYVILADTSVEDSIIKVNGFRIFIYDYEFNFLDEIHSTDDLEELQLEEWWE